MESMTPRNAANAAVMVRSDITTGRLVALALTLPVADTGNELFGRSHAFYAIAHAQDKAIEFVLGLDSDLSRRVTACRALALAGQTLALITGKES